MPAEPAVKRAIAFVDGQNLFHNARSVFGYIAGEEKGIDVRLALDALDAAHRREFDVALIFSQDQDLSELASLIRQVSAFQNRWIKIASAFPDSLAATNRRGINRTDWCPIDQATYDACIDPRDYRPRP